jgi:hypothetical protein
MTEAMPLWRFDMWMLGRAGRHRRGRSRGGPSHRACRSGRPTIGLGLTAPPDVNSHDGKLACQAKREIGGNDRKLDKEAERCVSIFFEGHPGELGALDTFICAHANRTITWAKIEAKLKRIRGRGTTDHRLVSWTWLSRRSPGARSSTS